MTRRLTIGISTNRVVRITYLLSLSLTDGLHTHVLVSLSVYPPHRWFIYRPSLVLAMQTSIKNRETIQAEVVYETPFRSLRMSSGVNHTSRNVSHKLVRLATSSGRLITPSTDSDEFNKNRRPGWRTLRLRAKATSNTEVIA